VGVCRCFKLYQIPIKAFQKPSISHQKLTKSKQKTPFFNHFSAKNSHFSPKNHLKINVKTAFLGVFRAFLGRKVYQMYHLFHLCHETVRHKKRAQSLNYALS